MAHEPTRKELQQDIDDLREEKFKALRELDTLRKELTYHQQQTTTNSQTIAQLYTDRERLTATIEVLARRLASDRPSSPSRDESSNYVR